MNYKRTKIACYISFVVQAIINNCLPILFIVFQKNYSLSYEKLGRIIFINFFTQLIADFLTPHIARLLGYKRTVIFCHLLAATGLCLLSVLPLFFSNIYACIMISVIVYAVGSGIIEVLISPMVELMPSKNHTAAMAVTHSFYCWGQAFTVAVTTVMVLVFGYSNWRYIPLLWAAVPVFNLFFFISCPVAEPPAEEKRKTDISYFGSKKFLCFVIFMVCAGAAEISMSEWASVFAQNALNINKFAGDLLGPCAFALFMGAGRVFFGLFSNRFSQRKVLIVNNILCFACFIAVGIANVPALSLLACALCGFGVSISWPGTYSLAATAFSHGGTLMFSIFALSGDLGCSVGPWLLGFVADRLSLKSGFFVCSVFPLIMLLAAIFLIKEKDCKPADLTV